MLESRQEKEGFGRCCRNCVHCLVETGECYEGGYTEIGDINQVRSSEDCNAWFPRSGMGSTTRNERKSV